MTTVTTTLNSITVTDDGTNVDVNIASAIAAPHAASHGAGGYDPITSLGSVAIGTATMTLGTATTLQAGTATLTAASIGSVSNAEIQYLDGLTEPLTTSLAAKVDSSLIDTVAQYESTGIETLDRRAGRDNNGLVSGQLRCIYFTPVEDITVTTVTLQTGTQAAAATPTLCRMALYATNPANDNLTAELANTANDTALFAATVTAYTKTLSTSVNLVAGTRYALGVLVVSSTTMPFLTGLSTITYAATPYMGGVLTGLSDLPTTFPQTPANSAMMIWGRLA